MGKLGRMPVEVNTLALKAIKMIKLPNFFVFDVTLIDRIRFNLTNKGFSGTPPQPHEAHVAKDHSPIDAMCEVTGGRSYSVTSQRVLHQCIDSLVQKLQSGVVIHFEKIGPDPPPLPNGKDEVIDVDNEAAAAVAATAGSHMDVEDFKGLTFSKDKEATGGGSNSSRPHTPNPMLAASNREWHTCRKLIYVPRYRLSPFTCTCKYVGSFTSLKFHLFIDRYYQSCRQDLAILTH